MPYGSIWSVMRAASRAVGYASLASTGVFTSGPTASRSLATRSTSRFGSRPVLHLIVLIPSCAATIASSTAGCSLHDAQAVADRDAVAQLAAQELVDGDASRLARDVVQRHVDGRLGVRVPLDDTVHQPMAGADLARVLALQDREQVRVTT